jgi:6-methylsalicylate decarboxylase
MPIHHVHKRVDVHAHYLPPSYYEALRGAGISTLDGGIPLPKWRVEDSLAMMNRLDIATQILSVSSPGVSLFDAEKASQLARAVNDEGAAYVKAYPERFGLFGTLPLHDVPASIAEIEHVFDHLGADGVVLMTNAHGIYLGEKKLASVFDALNARKAVVFLHPTSPACFESLAVDRPAPMIEFPFDTTRAATSLVFSGTTQRCSDIKFILPHAGGTLPFLVLRIINHSRRGAHPMDPAEALAEMRRFYCDTAGSANAHAIPSLRQLIPVTQMLFGSDFPFTPEASVERFVEFLGSSALFNAEERVAIARANAIELFPRLADAVI